jgi:hypothetical protein
VQKEVHLKMIKHSILNTNSIYRIVKEKQGKRSDRKKAMILMILKIFVRIKVKRVT